MSVRNASQKRRLRRNSKIRSSLKPSVIAIAAAVVVAVAASSTLSMASKQRIATKHHSILSRQLLRRRDRWIIHFRRKMMKNVTSRGTKTFNVPQSYTQVFRIKTKPLSANPLSEEVWLGQGAALTHLGNSREGEQAVPCLIWRYNRWIRLSGEAVHLSI